jgi:hypothetical protein
VDVALDPRFYEAWFNADHTVLGRRLHPFCLQDALILSMSESPFLAGTVPGIDYGLEELQVAVTICSTPADTFLHARFNRSWPQKVAVIWWSKKWRKICAHEDALREQCQRFVNYIDDYNSPPEVWYDESDSPEDGKMQAPWILGNVVFLIRHTSFTPQQVWTMPIGQALWYCVTLSEQLGRKIQVVSTDELEAMREMGLL